MAKGLVTDTNLTNIANAIRAKNGSSNTYTPAQMTTAIQNILSAVELLESKTNLNYALAYSTITTCPTFTPDSSVKNFSSMFNGCTDLTTVPLLDTSKGINFSYMFQSCTSLTTVSLSNTSNGSNFSYMFRRCSELTTVPQFNFVKATSTTSLHNMFSECPALSSTSLNNILASIATKGGTATTNKTLNYIGLTSEQATTCTGLSNWSAASAAGWTTGY